MYAHRTRLSWQGSHFESPSSRQLASERRTVPSADIPSDVGRKNTLEKLFHENNINGKRDDSANSEKLTQNDGERKKNGSGPTSLPAKIEASTFNEDKVSEMTVLKSLYTID